MSKPNCPQCRRSRNVVPSGNSHWFCKGCKGTFDDDPDEGGTYSDRNPAARLEREERQREQRLRRRN